MSERFDDLARRLAAPMPRRRLFGILAGALAALVLPGTARRGKAANDERVQKQAEVSAPNYLLDFETRLGTEAGIGIMRMHVRALNVPLDMGADASNPVSKPLELLSFTGETPENCTYSSDIRLTRPFTVYSGELITTVIGGKEEVTDVELTIMPGDLAGSFTWHCKAGDGSSYDVTIPVPDGELSGLFVYGHVDDEVGVDPANRTKLRIANWSMGEAGSFARKTYSRPPPVTESTTFTLRRATDCCPVGGDCCDPARGLCCAAGSVCCNPGPQGECCPSGSACVPSSQFVPGQPLPPYVCCPSSRACKGECCGPGQICVADILCCSAAGVCGENSRACCDPGVCCGGTGCCPSPELGYACCNNSCVDLQFNRANCGSCGHGCKQEELCVNGLCVPAKGRAYLTSIIKN